MSNRASTSMVLGGFLMACTGCPANSQQQSCPATTLGPSPLAAGEYFGTMTCSGNIRVFGLDLGEGSGDTSRQIDFVIGPNGLPSTDGVEVFAGQVNAGDFFGGDIPNAGAITGAGSGTIREVNFIDNGVCVSGDVSASGIVTDTGAGDFAGDFSATFVRTYRAVSNEVIERTEVIRATILTNGIRAQIGEKCTGFVFR